MCLRKLLPLSVLLVTVIFTDPTYQCIDEEVQSLNGSMVIWSDTGENYEISSPVCFDEQGRVVVRQCLDGKWTPAKDGLKLCEIIDPEFSVYTKSNGKKLYYRLSSERESFNTKDVYDYSYQQYEGDLYTEDFWSVIKPLGKFYNNFDVSPGANFGQTADFLGTPNRSECYYVRYGLTLLDDCNNKHYKAFLYAEGSYVNPQKNCPSNSRGLLYKQDVCYGFMPSSISDYVTPKTVIKNAHEMFNLLEEYKLKNIFLRDGTTLPGLDVEIDAFEKLAIRVTPSSEDHQILTYFKIRKDDIKMTLKKISNFYIEISCSNCHLLWADQPYSDHPGYTCFTDAGQDYLQIVKVMNWPTSTHLLQLHSEPGKAHYWCSAYSIFDSEFIQSEKLVAGMDEENYKEFVFYVKRYVGSKTNIREFDEEIKEAFLSFGVTSDPESTDTIPYPKTPAITPPEPTDKLPFSSVTTTTKLPQLPPPGPASARAKPVSIPPSYYEAPVEYIRTFEILDESMPTVTVVCHIVTDSKTTKDEVYSILKNKFEDDFYGKVNNTDFCERESIEGDLFWRKTKQKEVSTLNRINYRYENGDIPTRKCLGSFLYGLEWEPQINETLKENPANITEFLENILNSKEFYEPSEILEDVNYALNVRDDSLITPLNSLQVSEVLGYVAITATSSNNNQFDLQNLANIVSFIVSFPPCLDPSCGKSSAVIIWSVEEIVNTLSSTMNPQMTASENFAIFTFYDGAKAIWITHQGDKWDCSYGYLSSFYFSYELPPYFHDLKLIEIFTNSNLFHTPNFMRSGSRYATESPVISLRLDKNENIEEPVDPLNPIRLKFANDQRGLCGFWNGNQWITDSTIIRNFNESECDLYYYPLHQTFYVTLIQDCQVEQTRTVDNEVLTWTPDHEYAVSKPLCEQADQKILTRQCVNGTWFPKASDLRSCTVLRANSRFCPYGFQEDKQYCVSSLAQETFPSSNVAYVTPGSVSNINLENYWLPLMMFNPEKEFYPMLSVNPGRYFGYRSQNFKNLLKDKSCAAVMSNELKPVSCGEKYHKIFSVEDSSKTVLQGLCNKTTIFDQTICYERNTQEALSVRSFTELQHTMEVIYPEAVEFKNSSSFENVVLVFDGDWFAVTDSKTTTPSFRRLLPKGKPSFSFRNDTSSVTITCRNCQFWVDEDDWSGLNCFTDAYNNYVQSITVTKISSTSFKIPLHSEDGLAQYWCIGHSIFDRQQITTGSYVLGRKPVDSDELAFFVSMDLTGITSMAQLADQVSKKLVPENALYVRAFEVIRITDNSKNGRVLIHAGTRSTPENFKFSLQTIFKQDFYGNVNNSEYCTQEPLRKDESVFWKTTKINQNSTLTSRNYTYENGKHPKRKCLGSFLYGGVWETFNEDLIFKSNELYPTSDLDDILNNINETNPVETVDALNSVTQESDGNLNSTNFEQIGQILENVNKNIEQVEEGSETEVIQGITSICDSLMITSCEDCSNSTNEIVASIEDVIDNLIIREDVELDDFGLSYFLEPNFTVIGIDPSISNISGLRFYKQLVPGAMVEGNIVYKYIFKDTSSDDFQDFSSEEHLSLATYIPEALINYLEDRNTASELTLKLVLKVYRNDNLFQQSKDFKNSSRIVEFNVTSISIPDFSTDDFSTHNIPLMIHSEGSEPECKFWSYETSSWSDEGISFVSLNNNFLTCNISHLTSFTHLVDVGHSSRIIDDFALDVITMTCSTLSLIGLVGIFLSAYLYPSWRRTRSTQVLLQLCLASFTQIIIFFVISTDNFRGKYGLAVCATFGSFLQYTLLVQFMWMLVIGSSNWMMYYKPFKYVSDDVNSPNGFKMSAICWGCPMIPVLAIIIFGAVNSYETSDLNYDICFPSSSAKIWGFIVPIYSILFVNMVFYVLLIIEFWKIRNNQKILQTRTDLKLLLRNLTILFFALGIPWIFGLLHVAISGSAYPNFFSYLFVLTAPLQGFVLFLYFIVLNPTVRRDWSAFIQRIRYNNSQDEGVANKFLKILKHPSYRDKHDYIE